MSEIGNVIKTKELTKVYHGKAVVSEVDLTIPDGCIYGFLGPNGAGKSTTMKMMLGLIKPTKGKVLVLGEEVNCKNRISVLKNTGSLIESPAYYGHLTGKENLKLVASLKQVDEKQVDKVLQIVHLDGEQGKKVSQYSLGMKQRLGFAGALLGFPKLLLLDEPTNGLDPEGIQEMRELICTLPREYGMTVLVSSHLLAEIDQMATHVGIINQGALLFQDRLSVLHEQAHGHIRLRTIDDVSALALLQKKGYEVSFSQGQLYLQDMRDEELIRMGYLLMNHDIGILRLEEEQKSLEDIFLQIVGRREGGIRG